MKKNTTIKQLSSGYSHIISKGQLNETRLRIAILINNNNENKRYSGQILQ